MYWDQLKQHWEYHWDFSAINEYVISLIVDDNELRSYSVKMKKFREAYNILSSCNVNLNGKFCFRTRRYVNTLLLI